MSEKKDFRIILSILPIEEIQQHSGSVLTWHSLNNPEKEDYLPLEGGELFGIGKDNIFFRTKADKKWFKRHAQSGLKSEPLSADDRFSQFVLDVNPSGKSFIIRDKDDFSILAFNVTRIETLGENFILCFKQHSQFASIMDRNGRNVEKAVVGMNPENVTELPDGSIKVKFFQLASKQPSMAPMLEEVEKTFSLSEAPQIPSREKIAASKALQKEIN